MWRIAVPLCQWSSHCTQVTLIKKRKKIKQNAGLGRDDGVMLKLAFSRRFCLKHFSLFTHLISTNLPSHFPGHFTDHTWTWGAKRVKYRQDRLTAIFTVSTNRCQCPRSEGQHQLHEQRLRLEAIMLIKKQGQSVTVR